MPEQRLPVVVPIVEVEARWKWRLRVPESHRSSLDTRIVWLWNQRFGTVQSIYMHSPDILDKTAAMLFLQAVMAKDLDSITQIFDRLEGSPEFDTEVLDKDESKIRM